MEATLHQSHVPKAAADGHDQKDAHAGPAPARARTRTILMIAIILVAMFAVFLGFGIVSRYRHNHQLASTTAQAANALPQVYVVHPAPSTVADWSLPGTTQAISDTIIYARVSGYLSKRYVDIGDHVKAGQLLAEIQSPEIDQQLSQARANLQQAQKQLDLQRANLELARTTLERYKGADQEGAVAKLTVDQAAATHSTAQASVAATQATVISNEANVKQYEAMTAFERVLAPFDGIITQRNVDVGALITAGSPPNNTSVAPTSVTGAASGLFEVAQLDTLRVFVNVPQVAAPNVKVGMQAQVNVRGALTTPAAATVARTANALDPATRTLLTEVDIPNSSHAMLPGQFVYVILKLQPSGQRWNLPATALIFNAQGTQVMIVGPDGKLRVQKVTVGRDFGDTINVQAGLSGSEMIVKQPDVSLQPGQVVTPIEPNNAPQS
jgi:multidrug efflux pump subunit AcrA (membrane-fusion protein)